jgi:hypothetical protein
LLIHRDLSVGEKEQEATDKLRIQSVKLNNNDVTQLYGDWELMVHSLNGLPEVSDLKFSLTLQLDRLSTSHPFFSDYREWRRLEKDDPQRTYEQLLVKLRYLFANNIIGGEVRNIVKAEFAAQSEERRRSERLVEELQQLKDDMRMLLTRTSIPASSPTLYT